MLSIQSINTVNGLKSARLPFRGEFEDVEQRQDLQQDDFVTDEKVTAQENEEADYVKEWKLQQAEMEKVANDKKAPLFVAKGAKAVAFIIGVALSAGVMKSATKTTLDSAERFVKSKPIQDAVNKSKKFVADIAEKAKPVVANAKAKATKAAADIKEGINKAAKSKTAGKVKDGVNKAAEEVSDKAKTLFAKTKDQKVYKTVTKAIGSAIAWVKNTKVFKFFKSLFNKIDNFFKSDKAKKAKKAVNDFAVSTKAKATKVASKAKAKATKVADKAKKVTGEQVKNGVATGVGVASAITAGAVGSGLVKDPAKKEPEEYMEE